MYFGLPLSLNVAFNSCGTHIWHTIYHNVSFWKPKSFSHPFWLFVYPRKEKNEITPFESSVDILTNAYWLFYEYNVLKHSHFKMIVLSKKGSFIKWFSYLEHNFSESKHIIYHKSDCCDETKIDSKKNSSVLFSKTLFLLKATAHITHWINVLE